MSHDGRGRESKSKPHSRAAAGVTFGLRKTYVSGLASNPKTVTRGHVSAFAAANIN